MNTVRGATRRWQAGRWLLLGLILLAYAHVTVRLDAKALWWDESLSLQRAEQGLGEMLRGVLWIQDGYTAVPTIDQHPFFSFLLQGLLLRAAGDSVFVLRTVSVIGATLLVPAVWVLARWLVRRGVAPPTAPWWAVLFTAISPFLLWYGQEARPYALWAMLAVLTTYLLLRATEDPYLRRGWFAGFVVAELAFLTTHYYAVFLLPLHALILFVWLARRSLWRALGLALVLVVLGSVAGLYGAWTILSQGGGQNFSSISPGILVPDLLNAFSLGLSVDLAQIWWIDWAFGALAVVGAVWGLRSRKTLAAGGWILPAFLLLPIGMLLVLDRFQPLYMNARHMSLLVGGFLLLVGAGLGAIWRYQRSAAGAIAVFLVAAVAYSTVNYYTLEEYAKDDYTRLGEYMDGRIMPGDAVLFYPPSSWRIFEYYLPLEPVHAAIADGAPLGIYGVPRLNKSMDDTFAWLDELGRRYRRVWVIKSGTHPYFDLKGEVEQWLIDNFLRVRDAEFFSHSSLRAQLYLPEIPVFEETPTTLQHPVTAEFGDLVRVAGFDLEPAVSAALPSPLKLYWQVTERPARRYKYIFQVAERLPDGQLRVLSQVEREPYEGDIPTLYWDPGKTILEYAELPPPAPASSQQPDRVATLQMYDAETLEKLPVTRVAGGTTSEDGRMAVFDLPE